MYNWRNVRRYVGMCILLSIHILVYVLALCLRDVFMFLWSVLYKYHS